MRSTASLISPEENGTRWNASLPATLLMMMVMAEQAVAVLEEVPNDQDIEPKDGQHCHRVARTGPVRHGPVHQLVDLDGDEEG